jgi:hypothetical protein
MEPSRLVCLAVFAVLLGPTIVAATDATGGRETLVAAPGSEPSADAPVIVRGTRPVSPTPAQAPNVGSERNRTRPQPYMGFQPAPLIGSGWNTENNYNGLTHQSVI